MAFRPASSTRDMVRDLLGYIQAEGLSVGDRLPSIRQLAALFGVKPSEARDALMQARTMGLVRILPRYGAFVASADYGHLVSIFSDNIDAAMLQADHSLLHLLETRQLIEAESAARVASRCRREKLLPIVEALEQMDKLIESTLSDATGKFSVSRRKELLEADIRFHLSIAHAAENSVQTSILHSLLKLISPHLVKVPWTDTRKEITLSGHHAVYDALLDGDAERARTSMSDHCQQAIEAMLEKVRPKIRSGLGQSGERDGVV